METSQRVFVARHDQAKQHEEMQAVADAWSLLANLVMALNTMKMHSVLDRWNARRATAVPPELIGRVAPTRTEGLNLRGVFTFPIEQYQAQLLPSLVFASNRTANVFIPTPATISPKILWTKYRHFWHGNQGDPNSKSSLSRKGQYPATRGPAEYTTQSSRRCPRDPVSQCTAHPLACATPA